MIAAGRHSSPRSTPRRAGGPGVDVTADAAVAALAQRLDGGRARRAGLQRRHPARRRAGQRRLDDVARAARGQRARSPARGQGVAPERLAAAARSRSSPAAWARSATTARAATTAIACRRRRSTRPACRWRAISAAPAIAVAILHPGYVRTDMTGGSGNVDPDDAATQLVERIDALNLGDHRHLLARQRRSSALVGSRQRATLAKRRQRIRRVTSQIVPNVPMRPEPS